MENGIRTGTISSIDKKTGMACVYFEDSDEEVSELLPYANFGGEYKPPGIGEMVIVAELEDGSAVILGPYWDDQNPGNPEGQNRAYRKCLGGSSYVEYDVDTDTLIIKADKLRLVSPELKIESQKARVKSLEFEIDSQKTRITASDFGVISPKGDEG